MQWFHFSRDLSFFIFSIAFVISFSSGFLSLSRDLRLYFYYFLFFVSFLGSGSIPPINCPCLFLQYVILMYDVLLFLSVDKSLKKVPVLFWSLVLYFSSLKFVVLCILFIIIINHLFLSFIFHPNIFPTVSGFSLLYFLQMQLFILFYCNISPLIFIRIITSSESALAPRKDCTPL